MWLPLVGLRALDGAGHGVWSIRHRRSTHQRWPRLHRGAAVRPSRAAALLRLGARAGRPRL
eukprot:269113-Pyramimonas_sp.AAC.1